MAESAPKIRYAAKGPWGSVQFAISANGKALAEMFFDGLPDLLGRGKGTKLGLGDKAKAKFAVIFQTLANTGTVPNRSRFSPEQGKIYGVKHEQGKKLIRFACFQEGNCWVLTHGFFKPGAKKDLGKWPQEQIKRAERIMAEHRALFKTKRA